MKEDLVKFLELVKTDEALQKKLEEAAKNYTGEQTNEAVFNTVIVPVAKEAGYDITLDDMTQFVHELNPDEMGQVAGGYGAGIGGQICFILGIGGGGNLSQDKDGSMSGGLCAGFGLGSGISGCLVYGGSAL